MMGLAALWMGTMLPALDWITAPKRWLLPSAGALIGVGFLLAGNFMLGKASPPPLVNAIGCWLDADSRTANWIAFVGGYRTDARTAARFPVAISDELDERQSQIMVNSVRRSYIDLFPDAPPLTILTSPAPPLPRDEPLLNVISDEWMSSQRVVKTRLLTSMHDRIWIIIPREIHLLALTVPNNERVEFPIVIDGGCNLRFDGMPDESIDITFEFGTPGPIQFELIEEKTGLPTFPGQSNQPVPGTMRLPGDIYQGIPDDFTAIYRLVEIPEFSGGK